LIPPPSSILIVPPRFDQLTFSVNFCSVTLYPFSPLSPPLLYHSLWPFLHSPKECCLGANSLNTLSPSFAKSGYGLFFPVGLCSFRSWINGYRPTPVWTLHQRHTANGSLTIQPQTNRFFRPPLPPLVFASRPENPTPPDPNRTFLSLSLLFCL